MSKKKKELQPVIEKKEVNQDIQDSSFLNNAIEQTQIFAGESEQTEDSYFKAIVNKLMDDSNPSTKTEYLNVKENFTGAKLQFLAKHGNIPYLDEFMEIFELKRISLQRKGRKELIMSLIERQQEIERQREEKLKNIFGG